MSQDKPTTNSEQWILVPKPFFGGRGTGIQSKAGAMVKAKVTCIQSKAGAMVKAKVRLKAEKDAFDRARLEAYQDKLAKADAVIAQWQNTECAAAIRTKSQDLRQHTRSCAALSGKKHT